MKLLPWWRLKQLQPFYESLAGMIKAGLPLDKAFSVLTDEISNADIHELAGFMQSGIRNGLSLSEIMVRRPEYFKLVDISMVKSGEMTGGLDRAFAGLAEMYKDHLDLISQLVSGLVYPVFMLHAAFIIPAIPVLVLKGFGAFASDALVNLFFLWVSSGIGIFLHLTLWNTLMPVQYGELLSVVSFRLIDKIMLARLMSVLHALYSAGLPLNQALSMALKATGAPYIASRLRPAEIGLNQGFTLSESFARCGRSIPRFITEMISVGEKSGSLDTTTARAAERYKNESGNAIKTISKILPTIIYLIVAAYIGFIIISFWGGYFGDLM